MRNNDFTPLRMQQNVSTCVIAQEYSCHTYYAYTNISVRHDIFLFILIMLWCP